VTWRDFAGAQFRLFCFQRRKEWKRAVRQPELYGCYSADEAIAFFGSRDAARRFCNDQWWIFPRTIVCLTTIGRTPNASYFDGGARFWWGADQPYRANDQNYPNFLPAQVIGSAGKQYSIQLFVRPRGAREYLYVGEIEPSYAQRAPGREGHGMACFALKSTLPSDVWVKLGGLRLGDLDFASVDRALDRLTGRTKVEDRLEILRRLVNFWHGPIRPEDSISEVELADVPLPLPLRWWYRFAGKRAKVMSGQNFLFEPGQSQTSSGRFGLVDGRLCFYAENQGVYQWATLPDGEDPPMFGRYKATDPWESERMSLSEHLILACLFEAVMCHANYGASVAWLGQEKLDAIVDGIPAVAIPPWRWGGIRFFVGRGAFACVADNKQAKAGKMYSLSIGAKTEHPLQFLKPHLDGAWEYVAV
jgi:hypothetical protein